MNYIKKYTYNGSNGEFANKEDLKSILSYDNKQLSYEENKFLNDFIENFILKGDKVNILGSKQIINCFKKIDNRKYDIIIQANEINDEKFVTASSYDSNNELIFNFHSNDSDLKSNNISSIKTIYNAKKSLLDSLFSINTFANFALSINNKELVLDNINKLKKVPSISNKRLKYRFIDSDDDTFLRAVVSSNKYKIYDNSYVLYLSLVTFSNMSARLGIEFTVDYFCITDSKMYFSLLERNETKISDNVYIRTGIFVKNSELGDGAAEIKATYKISNRNGKKVNAVLEDNVATINHGYNSKTIKDNIDKLLNFKSLRLDIINEVKKLSWSKNISKDDISIISYSLKHLGNNIPKGIKEEMINDIDELSVTKKTVDLLDVFDLLDNDIKDKNNYENTMFILASKFSSMISKLKNYH